MPALAPVTTPTLTPVTAPARSSGFDLGDCPDDLLRQAWLEEQPLQMAAVEAEVLALCTERAEAIAGFLRTRALQDAALGRLQGSRTSPPVAPRAPATAPTSPVIRDLTVKVNALTARIARLEAAPEGGAPEDALHQLRLELATAQDALVAARAAEEATGDASGPAPQDLPHVSPHIQGSAAATARPNTLADAIAQELADRPDDPEATSTDQPERSNGLARVAASGHALADARPIEWQVVHAVRRGDGPWSVRLRGAREVAIPVPGATPEDPPTLRWQTVTEPPVTRRVGETLPDGSILQAVTRDGVRLRAPAAAGTRSGSKDALLPFASGEDTAPGTLDWKVIRIEGEGRDAG